MTSEISVDDFKDKKVEYLKMIQAVITRMASESTSIKRYSLLSCAIAISASVTIESAPLALAGAFLLAVLWGMDAMYLAQERWFRELYEDARQPSAPVDFDLAPSEEVKARHTVIEAMFRKSVLLFHVMLIVLSIGASLTIGLPSA